MRARAARAFSVAVTSSGRSRTCRVLLITAMIAQCMSYMHLGISSGGRDRLTPQLPAGADEVARLAIGMLLQVILVVLLRLPELPCRCYLRHDFSGPEAGCIDVGDGVDSDESLPFIGVEDGRTDVAPYLIALPVYRRRIVDPEEELQQTPVRNGVGVIDDLHRLGVIAAVVVGGVRGFPTGISDSGRDHPGLMAYQLLGAPVAPTCQDCRFS